MHWEVDYTVGDNIEEKPDIMIRPEDKKNIEAEIAGVLNYLRVYNSQFAELPSKGRQEKIIWFYQQFCEIAFVNNGRVTLDIDDMERSATLKYMGKSLTKTLEENDKTGMTLATIFYLYDFVAIEHEEKQITLTIFEKLFEKVLKHDESAELKRIRAELRNRNERL